MKTTTNSQGRFAAAFIFKQRFLARLAYIHYHHNQIDDDDINGDDGDW